MRHLNEIFAQHPFEFWLLAIVVGIFPSYASSFVAFVGALSGGLRAAIREQRKAKLRRLEAYLADRTSIFRLLLAEISFGCLLYCFLALHTVRGLLVGGVSHSERAYLNPNLTGAVGAVFVMLVAAITMVGYASLTALVTLWSFRDPGGQIRRILRLLHAADPSNKPTETRPGAHGEGHPGPRSL